MRIIGHRGNSATAPENTMASFAEAFRLGSQGVELDVTLSSDEQVVVFHDTTLSRTTNGQGKLEAHTYQQLAKLDAGSWFSPKFRGERIPLLSDVFEHFGNKGEIIVEIKDTSTKMPLLVEKVISLVQHMKLTNTVTLQSFFDQVLVCAHTISENSIRLEKFIGVYQHPLPILIGWELNVKPLASYTYIDAFGFDYGVSATVIKHLASLNKKTYLGARKNISHANAAYLKNVGLEAIMRNDVTPLLDLQ